MASSANINVTTVVNDTPLKKLGSTIESIIKVTQDATAKIRETAQKANEAIKKAAGVRKEIMLQAANVSQLYMGMRSAVAGLQDVLGSYAETYNNAAVASKKLEVVMKERMNATAEDIKSINDVTNAQKELGVISGSVQKAGAQQVGTFISHASTLRTLIPAMNNLLAQQKGVNATQEDAVGIGNLMGKAMQGQTSALRRVGITFSEAEEKILKYGTESERAATLAQVITNNVGEMNAELAKTDAGKMKQLQNTFGGIKAKIGKFVTEYREVLTGASQVAILIGAMVQLKGVVMGAIGIIKSFGATLWASTVTVTKAALATQVMTRVQAYLRHALVISTAAARATTVALMGITAVAGVSLLIWGIVKAVDAFSSSTDKAAESTSNLMTLQQAHADAERAYIDASATARQEATKLQDTFARLKEKKKLSKKESLELKNALGSLRGMFGDLAKDINNAADAYAFLAKNMAAYAEIAGMEAQATEIGRKKAEAISKQPINERKRREMLASGDAKEVSWGGKLKNTDEYSALIKESFDLQQIIDESDEQIKALQASIQKSGFSQINPKGDKPDTPKKKKGETAEQRLAKEIREEKEKNDRINKMADEAASYSQKREDERIKKAFEARQNAINLMKDGKEKELAQNRLNYDKALQDEADYQREQLKQAQDHADKMWELDARNKNAVDRGHRNPQKLTNLDLPASDKIQSHLRTMTAQSAYQKANAETNKKHTPARLEELHTIDDLTKAISHYQEASNKQSGEELYKTQRVIEAHETKLSKLRDTGELFRELQEVRDIKGLSDREMTIKIRAIGIEELTARINKLQKQLADQSNPVGDAQRKDIQSLIATYSQWRAVSVRSIGTVKTAWGGVQGIGDSISSMAESLQGSANAWQKVNSVINGFFSLSEGIKTVVEVMRTVGMVSKANAAAKAIESAAHYSNIGAVTAETAAVVSASAAKAAANKVETTTAVAAAASQTFAAHAGIPFVGIALGAGLVATMLATMLAIPKFADGGIAYGPTLGLFGEYAGASHNPEVVAPLDKLRSLIAPQGGGGVGKVEFRIEGRHLVGILNKEGRHRSRNY